MNMSELHPEGVSFSELCPVKELTDTLRERISEMRKEGTFKEVLEASEKVEDDAGITSEQIAALIERNGLGGNPPVFFSSTHIYYTPSREMTLMHEVEDLIDKLRQIDAIGVKKLDWKFNRIINQNRQNR